MKKNKMRPQRKGVSRYSMYVPASSVNQARFLVRLARAASRGDPVAANIKKTIELFVDKPFDGKLVQMVFWLPETQASQIRKLGAALRAISRGDPVQFDKTKLSNMVHCITNQQK